MAGKLFFTRLWVLFAMPALLSGLLAGCGAASGSPDKVNSPTTPTPPAAPTVPNPSPSIGLRLDKLNITATKPVFVTAPPRTATATDNRLFIVERGGRILVAVGGQLQAAPVLDISNRTTTDGERGLLSMAFDPQFASNALFYVYFTTTAGDIAVERFRMSSAVANTAEPGSVLRIITIPHPVENNHNGGLVAFGLDNMLYLATGDGGGKADQYGNAQKMTVLLGKMLRLDVRNATSTSPYAIPADNPYADGKNGLAEIWASGLRNPWRFAFDPATSQLFIADVGQDKVEEINVAPTNAAGLNYGWVVMEGSLCYNNAGCNKAPYRLPVFEYDHGPNKENGCSIIGGTVYRGSAIPELTGHYFYSDYCKAFLRSLVVTDGKASIPVNWPVSGIGNVESFGTDGSGELYLVTTTGIYKIVKQ